MTEQLAEVSPGITLAYEELGEGEPIVLVAGLGMQLHSWPDEFCALLAGRGYRVIRFDNRDVGRSTHLPYPPPTPATFLTRRWHPLQYTLADMAHDTVGLLNVLDIADAHLVGVSMGGMIAQTVAAAHPERARTLTSIMSTTGARRVGRPALSTWRRMAARPARSREAAIARAIGMFRHVGSHGFPFDEPFVRDLAGLAWDRDPSPVGAARQLAAVFRSGDRTAELAAVTAPTLVIHGDRDRMIHPTGAVATARAIPGARLETIVGFGHDLPRGVWPTMIDLIDGHARAAGAASRGGADAASTA